MKYAIKKHEAWYKQAYESSGIYAPEAAAHFADLLAEVKRLRALNATMQNELHKHGATAAHLADAVALLEKLKKAQCLGGHPMFLGALVRQDIDDLLARISGGGK